jgi:hypothetical protein
MVQACDRIERTGQGLPLLNGFARLDMSRPALYTGLNTIKVITQSDAATIQPGKGTAMIVSQVLTAL